ncbi:hypothetical protein DFH28DRAFT_1057571 [Melampsora americana]|nr:hypothetical protein DFH28DRAFT_1057571 [Melampsora americana]
MYKETIQSSPLVLFSSLPISSPFQYSSISIDSDLIQDSFISLLNDQTSQSISIYRSNHSKISNPIKLEEIIHKTNQDENCKILGSNDTLDSIRSIVLHLQSPNCKSTFIRFPGLNLNGKNEKLGIKLPFLHLQLKFLNHHFLFEIEIQDECANLMRIRCSSFQKEAKFYPSKTSNQVPLLHIPITLSSSSPKQTNWFELLISIKTITETHVKFKFQSINWIKIHSNCRLRKIYFSKDGKGFGSGRDKMNKGFYDFRNDRMIVFNNDQYENVESNQKNQSGERVELMLFKCASTHCK